MTADVELLPLPEGEAIGWTQAWGHDQMRAYARAVAEHNINRERERADRLAEALRGMMDKWDRIGDEHGVRQFTGNDHKLFANELRALLRDQDQEVGNG